MNLRNVVLGMAASLLLASQVFAFGPSCGCEPIVAPACCEPAPSCCGHHHVGLLARLHARCHAKHACCEPACGCEVIEPACGCDVAPAPCCEPAPACCEPVCCGGHHHVGLLARLKARCHSHHSCCVEPTCGCDVVEPSCGVEPACCN